MDFGTIQNTNRDFRTHVVQIYSFKHAKNTNIFLHMKKKSKSSKMIIKKSCHASKNSVKTTSNNGVYDAKKIMFILHLVMKIFAFEVRGVY